MTEGFPVDKPGAHAAEFLQMWLQSSWFLVVSFLQCCYSLFPHSFMWLQFQSMWLAFSASASTFLMILAFSLPPYPSSLMNLDRELPENPRHPTSTVHIIVFQWLFLVSSTSCSYFVLFSSAAISMLSSNGTVSSIKIICFVDSEVNIRSGFNLVRTM